jgi:GLPGLI family protein
MLFAQSSKFVTAGAIEYDKSVNMFAIGREMLKSMQTSSFSTIYEQAFDQYQKNRPQFGVVKSTLTFGNNKSLYTPGKTDNVTPFMGNTLVIGQFNTVYTDLSSNSRVVQKNIMNDQYLLKDSLSKIKWKIIGGSEEIAGYSCREAHGVIQDSVYVVAFFTDKIRVNSGPESFSGLPGMILKLLLPHEHITYTATKVTVEVAPQKSIVPPVKGKPVNSKQLFDIVKRTGPNGIKFYMF